MQISGLAWIFSTFWFLYFLKRFCKYSIAFHSFTKSKNSILLCATKWSTSSCSAIFFTNIILFGSFLNSGYIPFASICAKHHTLASYTYSHDNSDMLFALSCTILKVLSSDNQLSILCLLFFQIFFNISQNSYDINHRHYTCYLLVNYIMIISDTFSSENSSFYLKKRWLFTIFSVRYVSNISIALYIYIFLICFQ